MSIYDNGVNGRNKNLPSQKIDPSNILNDSYLTKIVKQIKNGPTTARELLYDSNGDIVGVLQRDLTPYFFSQNQVKELEGLLK